MIEVVKVRYSDHNHISAVQTLCSLRCGEAIDGADVIITASTV